MIEAALGVVVRQHYDVSRPSRYDLNIVRPGRPARAVEVTTASDPDAVELWNLVNE